MPPMDVMKSGLHRAETAMHKEWVMPAVFLALGVAVVAWAGAWTKELHDTTARDPEAKASRQELLDTMRHTIMLALGFFLIGLGAPHFIGLIKHHHGHASGDAGASAIEEAPSKPSSTDAERVMTAGRNQYSSYYY